MTVGEGHVNGMGTLHGGMVATLIDTCTSALVFTKPPYHPGVSIDMSIRYLFYCNHHRI